MSNPYITPYSRGETAIDRELEDRRCALLSRISSHASRDNPTGPDSILELKRAYNRIIREQWMHKRGAFADPLIAFPEEIWQTIILEATADRVSYDPLLDLLNVSQTWMTKMMSSPALWTTIILHSREEDLLAKIAVFIDLSQQSWITLQIYDFNPSSISQDAYDLVAKAKDRITVISMPYNVPVNRNNWKEYPISRLGQGHFPVLEKISFTPNGINIVDVDFIYSHVPTLKEITQIRLYDLETLSQPSLLLQNARDLSLAIPQAHQQQTLARRNLRLNFVNLRSLHLEGDPLNSQDIISRLESPLVSLSIESRWHINNLGVLISLLGRFSSLQALTLYLRYSKHIIEQEVQPQDSLPRLSVTSLVINFLFSRVEVNSDATLARVVGVSMPKLESLELVGGRMTKDVALLLKSLSLLQSLTIICHLRSSSTDLPPIHLNKLKNLIWNGGPSYASRDHPLTTPLLTSYHFQSESYGEFLRIPALEKCVLPQMCIHSLVKLSFDLTRPVSLFLLDLPMLRELGFLSNTPTAWASDIIEQLIIIPEACPYLYKVVLNHTYNDWDILLLALERRNFLHDSMISPIREIHLTRPIPYKLIYLMTRLLAGKFASYVTIEELAATRFRHSPGPIRCYNCGLSINSEPLSKAETAYGGEYLDPAIAKGWTYDIPTDGQTPDPPLKKDVDDWLKGKWSRRREYTRYIDDAMKQCITFQNCSLCRIHTSMVVTAHTLDGISEEE
ncbi:hypothetical protein FRC17_004445 [Serendipita sp. 399]|nr:hypothetical protein FRC17_004445 [Serendipita sp. 399]